MVRPAKAQIRRLAWALRAHGHLLATAVKKDTSAEARKLEKRPISQIPEILVQLILERADPTQNKGMTAWLVRQYARGALRLEDLGTANETLTMFLRYAQRLEPTQRDLGRHQNLAAVWDAVIGFANAEEQRLGARAQKTMDKAKAYAESRILRQDPDGFTIAVPLTEFAAKWWGKGTRWCTAAKKNNQFGYYHKDAPLIVIVIPELGEQGKFQLWAHEKGVQFMDAADRVVSYAVIEENWARLRDLMLYALSKDRRFLGSIPENLRADEIAKTAVRQDGRLLRIVPQNARTIDVCEIAIKNHEEAFQWVPKDVRTEAMYEILVGQYGKALEYVPEATRTEKICRTAVERFGGAFRWVPKHLRTEEICRLAVSQNGWALGWLPEHLRTEELCRIAVGANGRALEFVPKKFINEELCRIAIEQDGWALTLAPERILSRNLCHIAVRTNLGALSFVPDNLIDEELYKTAATHHKGSLWDIPKGFKTKAVCKAAVTRDGLSLVSVPEELRTAELCEIAVMQNGRALAHVPKAFCSERIYKLAVSQNGLALGHVSLKTRLSDNSINKIAVQNDYRALAYVPKEVCTEELCKIALEQDDNAILDVPETLLPAIDRYMQVRPPTWHISELDDLSLVLNATPELERLVPGHG